MVAPGRANLKAMRSERSVQALVIESVLCKFWVGLDTSKRCYLTFVSNKLSVSSFFLSSQLWWLLPIIVKYPSKFYHFRYLSKFYTFVSYWLIWRYFYIAHLCMNFAEISPKRSKEHWDKKRGEPFNKEMSISIAISTELPGCHDTKAERLFFLWTLISIT